MRYVLTIGAAMITLADATSAASDERVTVAVDLSALDADTFAQIDGLQLERKLVLRLAQEGFAVVAIDTSPQVSIQLQRDGGPLVVVGYGPRSQRVFTIDWSRVTQPSLHLEVLHHVTELARQVTLDADLPLSEPLVLLFDVAAGAGASWRQAGPRADPQVFVEGRLGPATGPLGTIRIDASYASTGGLSLWEATSSAGIGWRGSPVNGLSLEAAGLGGALHHGFHTGSLLATESGYRVAVLAALAGRADWRMSERFSLRLSVLAAWTGLSWEHRLGETVLWRGGPFRLAAGLGLVMH